jgi:hypothetical protein
LEFNSSNSATATALGLKAPSASPTFTGTVTVPTHGDLVAKLTSIDTAVGLKAPSASPTFTGTVTVPTHGDLVTKLTSIDTAIGLKAPINNSALTGTTTAVSLSVTSNITSGGTLTASNLLILGDTTVLNTTVKATEQFSVSNSGSMSALVVTQHGAQNIAEFYDGSSITLMLADGGNVGIGLANPSQKLDVAGNIKAVGATFTGNITALDSSFTGDVSVNVTKFKVSNAPTLTNLMSVAWSPSLGIFAALSVYSLGNRVMTSYNGIDWTTQTSAYADAYADSQFTPKILWADSINRFVIIPEQVSGGNIYIMTSQNGVNWSVNENYPFNFEPDIATVTWASTLGMFVAADGRDLAISYDGIQWSVTERALPRSINALVWAPELTRFIGIDNTRVVTSSNGINWTFGGNTAASNTWNSIAWAPELGLFAAVSSTGIGNRVMTSTDGFTWTIRNSAADKDWVKIEWAPGHGLFVALSHDNTNNIMVSNDGIVWTLETIPSQSGYTDIVWSPQLNTFAAVGQNDPPVIYKPGGIGGKVGIGSTTPTEKLDVVGNIKATGMLTLGSGATIVTTNVSGNVGIGSATPSQKLDVVGNIKATGMLTLGSGATIVTTDTNGNVGIGSATPTEKLDVIGNIKATGATFTGTVSASGATSVLLPDTNLVQCGVTSLSTILNEKAPSSNAALTGTTTAAALNISGKVGVGTSITPLVSLAVIGTDAIQLPKGTDDDRATLMPLTSYAGCIRYNTTTSTFEGCSGVSPTWQAIGGGGGGGGGTNQWAVSGSNISYSSGNVSFGTGLSGSATTLSGPFMKQGGWSASNTSHTISDFYVADNSSGTIIINVKSPTGSGSAKIGSANVSFMKTFTASPEIFTVSLQKNANLSTFALAVSGNSIVVSTDAGCSVCWTSTGAC